MRVDLVRVLVSLVVAVVLAWAACELFDWIASEASGDFPNGLLCVLSIAAAIIWWVMFNFGGSLRGGSRR